MNGRRIDRYERISGAIEALDDSAVRSLLGTATQLGHGIGGTSFRLDVEATPVFAKCLALTDLEMRSEHVGSTANYFDLPAFCHYGIGGPGFGAWRELEMLGRANAAVLGGETEMFPLTYGWRVLPGVKVGPGEELLDIDASVAFWEGSPTVRRRLQALHDASAAVVVLQEHIPQNLSQWLAAQLHSDGGTDTVLGTVQTELVAAVGWMSAKGWLHFDAHFDNIQADGSLYFADFGLALADDFDLSDDERSFAAGNATYDMSYVLTYFVRWLVASMAGLDAQERDAMIAAAAEGAVPHSLPPKATELVVKYAPVAALVMPFYRRLQSESRHAEYPELPVRRALARLA
jgi:hypothetical protein